MKFLGNWMQVGGTLTIFIISIHALFELCNQWEVLMRQSPAMH